MRRKIESVLENFFSSKEGRINDEVRRFTLNGGKRLRPRLLYHTFLCFREDDEEVFRVAASLELIQSFLLIHDDIMDKDALRRGMKTVHERYYEDTGDRHLSNSLAIVAGDVSYTYAVEIINSAQVRNKEDVVSYVSRMIETVCRGQHKDLLASSRDSVKDEEILDIYRLKTAAYSTTGPMVLGGLLAGRKDNSDLERIGELIGIAFQLKDDILGIFGSEDKIGKPVGSDIEEGKKTLLAQGLDLSGKSPEEAREIIRSSGNLERCRGMIKDNISEAKKCIAELGLKEEGRKFILDICDYIGERDH
ncbi:MAG: polyprenyl synthetase family protein [Nanobdellota archaeon]